MGTIYIYKKKRQPEIIPLKTVYFYIFYYLGVKKYKKCQQTVEASS